MKKFQVAPFDQHLTCEGRDLNDNQATLASLRIFPGTVIILQVQTKPPPPLTKRKRKIYVTPFRLIRSRRIDCLSSLTFPICALLFCYSWLWWIVCDSTSWTQLGKKRKKKIGERSRVIDGHKWLCIAHVRQPRKEKRRHSPFKKERQPS
jgi:hypothetical protein